MAKYRSKPNKSGRNENSTARFTRLPHEIWRSPAYCSLTPNARALLIELISMENGGNNGSLWLSIRDAAARMGLANKDSAKKAFDDLRDAGFVAVTKDAHFAVKAGDTSRARCWRLTFLHCDGAGKTDEWRYFQPADKAARRRAELGLRAHKEYRRAASQGRFPVLDSSTIKENTVAMPSVPVRDLSTVVEEIDGNLTKSVVLESGPHTADTKDTQCERQRPGPLADAMVLRNAGALPNVVIAQRCVSGCVSA